MAKAEKKRFWYTGDGKKMLVPIAVVVATLAVFAFITVCLTTQHQTTVDSEGAETASALAGTVHLSQQAFSTICRDVEAPFWAIDCNTALLRAYRYYAGKYGEVENYGKIGFHGLRVFRDRAYYVFGFYDRNAESPTCIVVNAINEEDVREDQSECE